MKKYAYKNTRLLEHADRTFPSLCTIVGFDNLYDGQIINLAELLEKIKFFKKYSYNQGLYIVEKSYEEYGDVGLHYFYWDTIINILDNAMKYNNIYLKRLGAVDADQYNVKICYKHGLKFDFERKN